MFISPEEILLMREMCPSHGNFVYVHLIFSQYSTVWSCIVFSLDLVCANVQPMISLIVILDGQLSAKIKCLRTVSEAKRMSCWRENMSGYFGVIE